MRSLLALGLASAAACASGTDNPAIDANRDIDARAADATVDGPTIDAPDAAAIDAAAIDAAVDGPVDAAIDTPAIDAVDAPPPVIAGLLLSEGVLQPTGAELIEIVNPTAAPIALSSYYLSDAPQYFRLPAGVAAVAADTTDFVVRFPAGATIPAGGVVTVALDTAANFTAQYPGVTPTYSVASATMTVLTAGTTPTLTNAGEPIVLFFWDGASDRVTDVDIMNLGTPAAANLLANKSGVAIDGPDADTVATAYVTDANTLPVQTAPGSLRSTKRLALESAATEIQSGGNGINGHDETSEQTGTTWDATAYTAPTPGQVPPALVP